MPTLVEEFEKSLVELVSKSFPQVDLIVAYSAQTTIESLFQFKDNTKNLKERSMVVFKLHCETCKSEYIGMSTTILSQRIHEHQTLRTGV